MTLVMAKTDVLAIFFAIFLLSFFLFYAILNLSFFECHSL
jgi:hypothetical protein